MKYLYCAVIPLALQALIVYVIIAMNTGNGSWIGLGVLLLAIPTLPLTTVINIVRANTKTDIKTGILFLQSLLIAFVVPIVIVVLYIITAILEHIF